MYYVYILRCQDGSNYTGITSDLDKRMREHYFQKKTAAKYTKSHKMVGIDAVWSVCDRSSALKLEYAIKRLPKEAKIDLIKNPKKLTSEYCHELYGMNPTYIEGINLKDIIDNYHE